MVGVRIPRRLHHEMRCAVERGEYRSLSHAIQIALARQFDMPDVAEQMQGELPMTG